MSGIDADAIVTAVLERLDGTLTGVRALSSGQIARGDVPGLDDGEKARRALYVPTMDAEITSLERHPGAPLSELSNLQILQIGLSVRTTYQLPTELQADDTGNAIRGLRNQAVEDAELVRQALMYPGGLATTSATTATNIITLLEHTRSEKAREDIESGLVQWEHTFTGAVRITPATS